MVNLEPELIGPCRHPITDGALIFDDALSGLRQLAPESIHALISDIPYGIGVDDWDVLHENSNSAYLGSSPAQEGKSAFKKRGKPINGWSSGDRDISKQYQEWCESWLNSAYDVLVPGASALIFAGRRYSHRLMVALENCGFTIKDQIAWIKPNAQHRAQRVSLVYERRGDDLSSKRWQGWRLGNLRPRFEPIIWATKPYPIGTTIADNILNFGVGAFHSTAFESASSDCANILEVGMHKDEDRIHPTQKPLALMTALVELVSTPGQIILDPFAGSGTTLVAAKKSGRRFIGFENNEIFFTRASERIEGTHKANVNGRFIEAQSS